MSTSSKFEPGSFKGIEQAGWDRNAGQYDALFGSVTQHVMAPLLDATGVAAGSSVLELCCGLGYGAGLALARGAAPIGIDFAPSMVQRARSRYPEARFEEGDAEALRFESGSFDAVICAFGVNHLAEPDAAVREAFRVLRRGGKFAFSMWCAPGKSKFHQLVLDAIRAHGTLDVPLPPAPPPFKFSDPATCTQVLVSAGFESPLVTEVPLAFRAGTTHEVLALVSSAVRMDMMIKLQTPEARSNIERAITDEARAFSRGGSIELPMPALVASARKPA